MSNQNENTRECEPGRAAPVSADASRIARWHITFGTYGSRLHGDARPTVDRKYNTPGTPFLKANPPRASYERERMHHQITTLDFDQRSSIEQSLPAICERGGWSLLAGAAASDHVHVLLAAPASVAPKAIRRWLKRWLGESLSNRFGKRPRWWAEGGSTKLVGDAKYVQNAIRYIERQSVAQQGNYDR